MRELLTVSSDGASAFAQASGVFYGFALELWFRWGILALASRLVSRVTGQSGERAFPYANVLASVALGVFALVSIYSPHAGETGAWRYALDALAGYGLSSAFHGMALRRHGLVSVGIAVLAHQWIAVALRVALCVF